MKKQSAPNADIALIESDFVAKMRLLGQERRSTSLSDKEALKEFTIHSKEPSKN